MWLTGRVLAESLVQVSADPVVRLLVAQTDGPGDQVLLVIHGGPDWDHTYLREPLTELAGRHRVIFADLRGCGRSTRGLPMDQYTPDAIVADLLALLDIAGIDNADVLGFSYGGTIAQRLTLAAPYRVRTLVISSSTTVPVPPNAYDDWPQGTALRNRQPRPAWLTAQQPTPDQVRADAIVAAPVNVWREVARPDYLRRIDQIRFSADWAAAFAAGALPPALPSDAPARLAALGLPVLLLHGRQDLTFPAALAEQAAAAIPSAQAVILDQAGHMTHIDQPQHWITALAAFLST
jgi:pimeloyl-ACP methyl ester carboxylesterase